MAREQAIKGLADQQKYRWHVHKRKITRSYLRRDNSWFLFKPVIVTVVLAITGGGLTIWGSTAHRHSIVVVGLLGTIVLGTLPPLYATRLLVLGSVCTYFSIGLFGFHVRLDMLIMPGVLLSMFLHGDIGRLVRALKHPVMKALMVFILTNVVVSLFMSPSIKKSETICLWYTINLVIVAIAIATYQQVGSAVLVADLYRAAKLAVTIGLGTYALNLLGVHVWGMSGSRARGIAFEPNILAGYAAIWTVILLTRRTIRVGDWVFIFLSAITFVVTGTRAAVVAVAIALVIVSMGRPRIARATLRGLFLCAVIIGVYLGLEGIIGSNAHTVLADFNRFRFSSSVSDGRFSYWLEAIKDLNGSSGLHWLSGLGTNSFGFRHIDPTTIYQPGGPSGGYLSNLVLLCFYDAGMLAFVSLAYVAWRLHRTPSGASHRRRYLAVIVAFVVIAGATNPFFFSYYWLFIAAVLLYRRTPERLHRNRKSGTKVMASRQDGNGLMLV